jgi:hypothetical protein
MLAGHYSQDAPAVKSGVYQVFIRIAAVGIWQEAFPLPPTACEE